MKLKHRLPSSTADVIRRQSRGTSERRINCICCPAPYGWKAWTKSTLSYTANKAKTKHIFSSPVQTINTNGWTNTPEHRVAIKSTQTPEKSMCGACWYQKESKTNESEPANEKWFVCREIKRPIYCYGSCYQRRMSLIMSKMSALYVYKGIRYTFTGMYLYFGRCLKKKKKYQFLWSKHSLHVGEGDGPHGKIHVFKNNMDSALICQSWYHSLSYPPPPSPPTQPTASSCY